ncbi:MAG: septal ring lytic transglycosylase RlpA family protein [Ideonella sp.]|nr:septal ring lytic transglycosylase RlpA family protein [Ideonella sp.]MCC7456714.1 septal ring lytic transglycosylase RlpA family protein [Nitrospira sp.]
MPPTFRRSTHCALLTLTLVLAGCAGTPRGGPPGRDGPGLNPPSNLMQVPDAEPRLEPYRSGGPNKPYEVFGRWYTPLAGDAPYAERGLASWYGRKFHGRPTSSGEPYDMYAMTAAHKTMPIPSYARVRNPANGREVIVRINDRGPFHGSRIIDLSYTAALKLGVLNAVAPVEVERITQQAIRTGAWRGRGGGAGDEGDRALAADSVPARPSAATVVAAARNPPPATAATPATAAPATEGAAAAITAPEGSRDTGTATQPVTAQAGDELRAPARPIALAAPGFWLQLGAFRERDGAFDFQRKVEREVDWLAPLMAVFVDRDLNRLQAGPYASRADATSAAERLRAALQLVPLVVERR